MNWADAILGIFSVIGGVLLFALASGAIGNNRHNTSDEYETKKTRYKYTYKSKSYNDEEEE